MTTAYTEFLPHITPWASSVFEGHALAAIRNACIEFCSDSLWLTEELDPISVTANENTYDLDVSAGYRPTKVLELYFRGSILHPRTDLTLRGIYGLDWQSLGGDPQVYTQFTYAAVVLCPRPTVRVANALTGMVALTPTQDSTGVDESVYEEHLETIKAGALARILSTPGEGFTDPAKAEFYMRIFRSAINNARVARMKGKVNAQLAVQPYRF